MKKTIGGDRLGSGKKMQVDLKTYNRSTHDLGYIWRSTMAAGTLVPFIKEVALPGDTFDIDLECDVLTHPTIGPLFGSYKVQIDVFQAPVRLYQSGLHNNAIGIGMRMKDIKLPLMQVPTPDLTYNPSFQLNSETIEELGHNPSSLLAHLDIAGAGINTSGDDTYREFNAIPYLAYWDIYKNYYANKQEEIGMYLTNIPLAVNNGLAIRFGVPQVITAIPAWPATDALNVPMNNVYGFSLDVLSGEVSAEMAKNAIWLWTQRQGYRVAQRASFFFHDCTILNEGPTGKRIRFESPVAGYADDLFLISYENRVGRNYIPTIKSFPLENIDTMREDILKEGKYQQFIIHQGTYEPYGDPLKVVSNTDLMTASQFSQEGLALKTYQSDLFNNWMSKEWVDNATTGINAITAVSTAGDSFTIDALNLAQKVYDMLNRIAISGGTYDDWLETVYTHEYINRAETPIYHGGLSRELVFQEVVSLAASEVGGTEQPVGTLAGRGKLGQRKKGGSMVIKVDEPSYIIGIVSLTPRIDYSQGNKWDVNLKTMDDFHKPALDEIGFQDLITDQMAWWDNKIEPPNEVEFRSAGKQPAWINYMTNVNKVRGNFALQNSQMFMTLNRRYEFAQTGDETFRIKDLTTYVDPAKFNFIFAETDLSSQNFWVQIGVDIIARRKMSAKIMPNL